jgi:small-conductance mechanosensitive channel
LTLVFVDPSIDQTPLTSLSIVFGLMKTGSASQREALRKELTARRAVHEAAVERLNGEIREKKDSCKQHKLRIQDLNQQISALDEDNATVRNYFERFEWSDRLMEQLRNVFGIDNFRLAQEGCVLFVFASPSLARP